MNQIKCPTCKKIIGGYSRYHVNYLYEQHLLKHRNEEQKELQKEGDKKKDDSKR